jgi:hypothetical protein
MAIGTLLHFELLNGQRGVSGVSRIAIMKKTTKSSDIIPVSQTEIEAAGARPRDGAAPLERAEDLLARYINVPNRMMLLYSSEDDLFSTYIRDNWAALDSMSGELCDIYTSMLQLRGGEDIYSFLDDLYYIPGSESIRIDKLPIILLWSDSASLNISLSNFSSDLPTIRRIIRGTFQCLYEVGRGIDLDDEPLFKLMLDDAYRAKGANGGAYSVSVDRRIIMTKNEYKADRGGVVIGDGAKTRDVIVRQNLNEFSVDLERLSGELVLLRNAMKSAADGSEPAHDMAIGQVAAAEHAARAGNRQGTKAALASAGKWALQIAEKIGVDLATAAIKDAMHGG